VAGAEGEASEAGALAGGQEEGPRWD